ncbi:type I toxin-antitoxin system Fst family toxin [Staphylococcus simiae]|uniref:type I toxin-antitoxin system Fst family toxin n=1 Tax=Staphylococcus simiae TaxID=308354 RepID=UPI0022B2670A|nr:type I toxin-antitoxin system Fst family toxin [Staphylococcus simiae]
MYYNIKVNRNTKLICYLRSHHIITPVISGFAIACFTYWLSKRDKKKVTSNYT